MKICRHCNTQLDDDALVCPHCGRIVKNKKKDNGKTGSFTMGVTPEIEKNTGKLAGVEEGNNNNLNKKNRLKKILWILGWIFVFPIPLGLLLKRNTKIRRAYKIAIMIPVVLIYFSIIKGCSDDSNHNNIENSGISTDEKTNYNKIEFSGISTDEKTIELGDVFSDGTLKVTVKSKDDFNPEKIIFKSDDTNIATISYTSQKDDDELCYEIKAVGEGETDVYAIYDDEKQLTAKLHIVVPKHIRVTAINFGDVKTNLVLGEQFQINPTIEPADAEDKKITWTTSDANIVSIDENGLCKSVGGGTAVIKAVSSNGVEQSVEINVDGSQRVMQVRSRQRRDDENNIGEEFDYSYTIDGQPTSSQMTLVVGQTLSFNATITENDNRPDVGYGSASYTVTDADLLNGFEVSYDVYVTENGGKNSGKSAHFIVTTTFSPSN